MQDYQPQFDRKRHGSLYDRGSADSHYCRGMKPHWWTEGTGRGTKIVDLSEEEIFEYKAGYIDNDQAGDHKDWT